MVLQPNTVRFQKFNETLKLILPQLQHISVRPSLTNRDLVEIIVWPTAKESTRIDLALPLSECGTGIGQVLAILYVVLNEMGDTIIIDEPQSFLHPGATRKLIEFLRARAKQQIIVATHSATVINAASPETITVTKLKGGETQFEQLDSRQATTLQLCLAEIGARLGDVFGAENILWVEGPTEVLCFPLILEKLEGKALMGTAIVGLRQVGDLQGRDAKRVLEIYHNLSKSGSLIPPDVGFVFDKECRSGAEQEELDKLGDGRVRFLPRRMFENYLLNPAAIASVLNTADETRTVPTTAPEIQALLNQKRADKSYYCAQRIPATDAEWIMEIDGARVVRELFNAATETRVAYDKVRHAPLLTQWLIANASTELQEVAKFLIHVLDQK
jgi:energy-coupling factor transporter ATP-binding protein EcfA2